MKKLESYLKDVLLHYANYNKETGKWEITFDELLEMTQFYIDKYWETELNRMIKK